MFKRLIFVFLIISLGTFPIFATRAGEVAGNEIGHLMARLVVQLSLIVISSRFFGFIFKKFLKQSSVLGELVAGMIIGPYALGGLHFPFKIPFLGNAVFTLPEGGTLPVHPELYGFAVVASIILLFLAGLETDLATFLRFSLRGSVVGIGGVILSFTLGDLVAVLALPNVNSFFSPTALFLGTLSTATSVGITARILSEKKKMSSPEGVTILAGAVLDDVLGIILLAVVVGISNMGNAGGSAIPWGSIGIIAAKAFGFWIVCTVLGILLAPKITRLLKIFKSKDIIAGVSLGLALLLAGLSEMAGLAMIIGAYVMGLSLSQTDIAHEIRERLHGLYQFLVPVFFCIMGMMVNFPAILKPSVLLFGLLFSALAVFSKIVGCGAPALLMGFNLRGAFRIGAGMLPRGEVTLIVAGIGLASGAIGQDMFGVSIITLFIASIIAPPILIASFKGKTGLRKKEKDQAEENRKEIELSFPSVQVAEFIRNRIRQAFRGEEFFVHRIDFGSQIYQIRKEDVLITMTQHDEKLSFVMEPGNEQLVRLIVLEEILNLQDLFECMKKMESADTMGARLLGGAFDKK